MKINLHEILYLATITYQGTYNDTITRLVVANDKNDAHDKVDKYMKVEYVNSDTLYTRWHISIHPTIN